MQPVIRGVAGGLLLALVVVGGVTLVSRTGSFASQPASAQDLYAFSAVTQTTTGSMTSSVTSITTTPPTPFAANATTTLVTKVASSTTAVSTQGAIQAGLSSAQTSVKSQAPTLFILLPIAVALVLGVSAYLLSRSRLEKEAQ